MTDSEKLRRGLFEGLVIVGSILLAFGIQAWWEDRQEREAADQFIEYLQEELVANRALIEQTVRAHSDQIAGFDSFLEDPSATFGALREDSAQVLVEALFRTMTISLSESVIGSSDVSIVRDLRIQRGMGEWMGSADDVREDLLGMVQTSTAMVRRAIDLSPEVFRFGTLGGDARFGGGSGTAALQVLRGDPAFIREGLVLQRFTSINRRKLNDLLAETDSLLAVIRE